jgi:hypothetical protein
MNEEQEFEKFASISRLSRDCIVTEKIDGTNACVRICTDGELLIGSRKRWIIPGDDNFGFAKWVMENETEIRKLGYGTHHGEWWGQGVQRKYGLDHKRFSLFNTGLWNEDNKPDCCHIVPVLYEGMFDTIKIDLVLEQLYTYGSVAAPMFMKPEGVVIWHEHARMMFKKTLDSNDAHKFEIGKVYDKEI